jgi:DNA-directed RNA polymerase subunit M/transcription elongation factor TFIIS
MEKKQPFTVPRIEGFECPSCGAKNYDAVTIPTAFEQQIPTGVYRCAECSFGFLNPERYVKGPRKSQ